MKKRSLGRFLKVGILSVLFQISFASLMLSGCRTTRHHHDCQGGLSLKLDSIYLRDGVMWLSFDARNRSAFDFRVDWMAFTIRGRQLRRRTAIQELRIEPVFMQAPSLVPGDSTASFLYGLVPRVLSREKEMVIELRERNGDRRLRLVIGAKDLLRARKK